MVMGYRGVSLNRHAGISDDTQRRRVQRDRVRRLQQANANHGSALKSLARGSGASIRPKPVGRPRMIVALQPSSPFDLIVEAEDVEAMWLRYPKCFGERHNKMVLWQPSAAVLKENLFDLLVVFGLKLNVPSTGSLPRDTSDPFGFALPGFGCRRDLLR